MSNSNERVVMLERVIQVMQQEMSQVLGELQHTILAMVKTNQITTQVMSDRLDFVEDKLGLKFNDDLVVDQPRDPLDQIRTEGTQVPETPAE